MPDLSPSPILLDFGASKRALPCWKHGEQPAAFSILFQQDQYRICPRCILELLENFCTVEKVKVP